jgi:hypothetical protein
MDYKKILIVITTMVIVIISCKKEESYNNSSKGTVSKNPDMTFVAVKSSASNTSDFEYVELIGHSEINNPDCRYFAITIYAPSIGTKTYSVPEYNPGYTYDNAFGYAIGYYSLSPSNAVTDWYSSQYISGASGSVTISGLSGDKVQGSYDLTLVSFKDKTKKLSLKGNFQANIASLNN